MADYVNGGLFLVFLGIFSTVFGDFFQFSHHNFQIMPPISLFLVVYDSFCENSNISLSKISNFRGKGPIFGQKSSNPPFSHTAI